MCAGEYWILVIHLGLENICQEKEKGRMADQEKDMGGGGGEGIH